MRKYPTKIGQGEVKVKMTMKVLPQARVKEHGTAEVRRAKVRKEDIHRQADAVETEIKIGRGENGHLMTGNQYGEIQVATKNTINIRNGKRKRKSEKHSGVASSNLVLIRMHMKRNKENEFTNIEIENFILKECLPLSTLELQYQTKI